MFECLEGHILETMCVFKREEVVEVNGLRLRPVLAGWIMKKNSHPQATPTKNCLRTPYMKDLLNLATSGEFLALKARICLHPSIIASHLSKPL